jgi:tRNA(fMet)-specific endonuclease VapC
MNGSILDTNVITKMLDKDSTAIRMMEKVENPYTSIIVVGELYFAAANSGRYETNMQAFQEALSSMEIITIDEAVAKAYADIRISLKRKGKPIPDNDIWIAACAFVHGLSIATFDGHFSEIEQVKLVSSE